MAKYKFYILLGLGILAIAIFLRVYNLNSIPVFVDEAIYVRWAQVMKNEPTLRFIPLSDGKQPLFMWSVIPALEVYHDPLIAGRVVSVFFGMGTLIGIFILSFVLFSSIQVSLAAAFIYAISPFSVFFDRLALVDSTLGFFGVWTFLFGILGMRHYRLDLAMIAGFFLGGALLTKSPGVYFALLFPLSLLAVNFKNDKKDRLRNLLKTVLLLVPTYLISIGMYNILRLGPNFHLVAARNKDYVYPLSHILKSPLDPLLPFLDRGLEYFLMLGPSVLVILVILGIFQTLKLNFKVSLALFLWGILPILVSSEFSKTMTARYIYFSIPYFFIFAATVLLIKTGKYKQLIVPFMIIFVVHSIYLNFLILKNPERANLPRSERSGYLEDWTSGWGIRDSSKYFEQIYLENPGQKIVIGTEGFFGTLPDGLQMYLNRYPEITVIGVGLSIDRVPNSLLESKEAGNSTFLVVNDSRLLANPEELGFEIIKKFQKAIRPDGTREELLLLELK